MIKKRLLIIFSCVVLAFSGCGESRKEPSADTESIHSESDKQISDGEITERKPSDISPSEADIEEKAETEFLANIFHDGAETYFPLLEGEWVVVEYAGSIRDSHCDEIQENWEEYEEEMREYANELTEKYMGSEYRVEVENLISFSFADADENGIIEDDSELFSITRFIPGEFIDIASPYIGLYMRLADKEEGYTVLIDANGIVLIELDYHFFRLERKSYESS